MNEFAFFAWLYDNVLAIKNPKKITKKFALRAQESKASLRKKPIKTKGGSNYFTCVEIIHP